MARKRAIWWLAEAIRLDAEGRSSRETREILVKRAKPGQKVPGQSTIFTKVKESKGVTTPAAPAEPAAPPAPAPPPEPLDESPMEPETLVGLLRGLLRQQTAQAQRLTAENDHQGAQRATRMATSIAAQLQKQQARDEQDGDSVRIRQNDIAAAAERARSKLHDLVSRLAAERSR